MFQFEKKIKEHLERIGRKLEISNHRFVKFRKIISRILGNFQGAVPTLRPEPDPDNIRKLASSGLCQRMICSFSRSYSVEPNS